MRFRLRLPLEFRDAHLERAYLDAMHEGNRAAALIAGAVALITIGAQWVVSAAQELATADMQLRNFGITVFSISGIVILSQMRAPWYRLAPHLLVPLYLAFAKFTLDVMEMNVALGEYRPERLGTLTLFVIGSYVVLNDRAFTVSLPIVIYSLIVGAGVKNAGHVPSATVTVFITQLTISNFIGIAVNVLREKSSRRIFLLQREAKAEKDRSDALICAMLPAVAADRLKVERQGFADTYPDATVLFADLVGFSRFAAARHPQDLVGVLSRLFGAFDEVVARVGGERIKTIGDAYMVVVGCPTPAADHAAIGLEVAAGFMAAARRIFAEERLPLDLRIGIHSGVLVGGVLSDVKPAFDVWGDTVNIAARLESAASPGAVLVSESTWELTRGTFAFGGKVERELKGIGKVATFEVRPLRDAA